MSRINQNTRETLAYIAVHHPNSPFKTSDIPKHMRVGTLSGLANKAFLETLGWDSRQCRTYRLTDAGAFYARRYASDEMEAVTS